MVAAYIAAGRAAELPDALKALRIGPQASFEVAFNCGCALLATGDLEPARQQLLHAQRLGPSLLAQNPSLFLSAQSLSLLTSVLPSMVMPTRTHDYCCTAAGCPAALREVPGSRFYMARAKGSVPVDVHHVGTGEFSSTARQGSVRIEAHEGEVVSTMTTSPLS